MAETSSSSSSPHPQAVGVHLVGSVPLPTASEVFVEAAEKLPGRLRRIPDGEPAHRQNFTLFQVASFSSVPQVLRKYDASFDSVPGTPPTEEDLRQLQAKLTAQPLPPTGYESAALESYAAFVDLRDKGVIPSDVKFQVSIPTPINVICLVAEGYQAVVEPFYEASLLASLKTIQASIPHEHLAIQIDFAAEFAMLEGAYRPHFKPFFAPVKPGVLERVVRIINAIESDVECGIHLCYGDIAHHHFIEPKDSGLLVEVAAAILKDSARSIDYIHMPVPKSRSDDAYFAPLKDLDLGTTKLALGLVHADDLEGTKARIEAAAKTGKTFAVATECGMGRTPSEQLASILDISCRVSNPL